MKWGARAILLDAVVEVEEMVTNAVKATGVMDETVRWTEITRLEYIDVRVLGYEASVRIEVWEGAPTEPVLPVTTDSSIPRGVYRTDQGKGVLLESGSGTGSVVDTGCMGCDGVGADAHGIRADGGRDDNDAQDEQDTQDEWNDGHEG